MLDGPESKPDLTNLDHETLDGPQGVSWGDETSLRWAQRRSRWNLW